MVQTQEQGFVHGGHVSFKNRRSGKICSEEGHMIAAQTWRIPREKGNINVLQGGVEENIVVYAKEKCSIPACNVLIGRNSMFIKYKGGYRLILIIKYLFNNTT